MEDTLQLKHLAPYLPYGLKYISPAYDHGMILGSKTETIEEMGVVSMMSMIQSSGRLKPLLHPLSRLTEPIGFDKNNISYAAELKLFTRADVEWTIQSPLGCDYQTIQKLLEWHFDVFGLIEKGLALEKPIKE